MSCIIPEAIESVRSRMGAAQSDLSALGEIAGVSARSFPPQELRRSAEAVADTLLRYGMTGVKLLETAGHPSVYGEKFVSADAPTILVYGHHDVMPAGRDERWISPPFQAVVRDGRIYGRGTSDDKGGFLAYLVAVRACIEARSLPCNIRMLIEGEEEIGSPNLTALLSEHRDLFECDFIVLCDTPNFDTGVPALTYRLRGNCIVDVEVRCLEQPVHSGQGGGLVPDATMILCRILARLVNEDGILNIPGLNERVEVDKSQLAAIRALPFDSERLREDFGFVDGVDLIRASDPAESSDSREPIWARPSLTITAIEAVPVSRAANQISDSARARLSLRTVRNLGTAEAGQLLASALTSNPPHRARVTANVVEGPSWWEADPSHPIFTAARRALSRGFGAPAVMTGSGGSIGFVKPFAELSGDVPPLLTGVQDPRSRAHSENESLHLGDWEKAMVGAVYLFHELAEFDHSRQQGRS